LRRTITEFNKLGLVCAFIGILILFAFLNHDTSNFWSKSQINWSEIEKSLTKDSLGSYSQETMMLVVVWVALMVIGSYLLVHIHFRLPREENR
jgi:NADH:ubiquinone oxidoreductase subunit 5 (subunit L)/multisubunit Na+/H+ antiporter MnhA subunit